MKFKVLTESEFKNFSETHENESFMQTVELDRGVVKSIKINVNAIFSLV